MLRFIEDKCVQTPQNMLVIVEADTPPELTNRQARDAVLVWARRQGFPARGISGIPQTYPVDAKGETNPEVVMGKVPTAAHRADYQLSAGIVV
jgi:hypothetical protein